ncbi:DUF423 domain-containing protein [Paenibacillus glacialis]|uniref:DUF423 domain-containing protein n=1 Tax=Paenibacillus glacialis TaxID=494026 RepID=A0A168LD05_9BACL|nr:DUF423 domain-containing protein [Paenibacillus glacialis]OAB43212.1 hypothetical protein PGLA_09470 [Paenibacillus glacialis]
MQRTFAKWGTILMALSVGIGAFGAHLLEPRIGADALGVYETGVHYHMIHALGLILIGLTAGQIGVSRSLKWAGWLLVSGIILFSGSLYVLSITGVKVLGAITPLGGVAFIAGWLCYLSAFLRSKKVS